MSKTKSPPKFKIADAVRVKAGVIDHDFEDIPIGGWAGEIVEIEKGKAVTYLVRWNERTLSKIHPVFRKRCERDGMEIEEMWLEEADLEPDTGEPPQIEHPRKIVTKPLSPKDEDDRIRMIFGLSGDDPLPDVDDDTLLAYHEYLSKNLAFPFQAEYGADDGHPESLKVIGLGEKPMIDDMYGIFCDVRMKGRVAALPLSEIEDAKGNRQLVADYCYWFGNWR